MRPHDHQVTLVRRRTEKGEGIIAEASLRGYCNKAKELIETGALDESISLCQYILRWYPKHVETYQLLGEACLEKGDHYEAVDLFKRVLSADPENFISYVGLSIIYDSEGSINESIWQLERAFELAPGNTEVRKELQRLYGLRDGTAPGKLKLTRGALGHLYSKDELFLQAIAEYEYLLQGDPDRVDLQLAEAEALWRDGSKREAAEVCQDILSKLPNCLKANLMLAKIWLENDLKSEAEPLLDVAQQLDAENRTAEGLFGPDSPLKARTATLPEMPERSRETKVAAETPGTSVGASAEELPDWLRAAEEKEEIPAEGTVAPPREDEPSIAPWVGALRAMVPDEVFESDEILEAETADESAAADLILGEAKAYPSRGLPTLEIPAWAQELRASVPDGWLRSGQEPTPEPEVQKNDAPWVLSLRAEGPQAQLEAPTKHVEAPSVPTRPGGPEMGPEPETTLEEAQPSAAEGIPSEPAAEGAQEPQDDMARLTWARAHMARGDEKAACQQYDMIVNEAPELVSQVIADLEKRLAKGKASPLLHRLLGDAYLKDGQLNKAFEVYRAPLDEM